MTAERTGTYPIRGPLLELTLARVRELIREPEAVFWVFVFPILLTAILGLAFRSKPPEALPVAVVERAACQRASRSPVRWSRSPAHRSVSHRGADGARPWTVVLVVSGDDIPSYAYDPTQPEAAPHVLR